MCTIIKIRKEVMLMSLFGEKFKSGTAPGKGTYKCTRCGKIVILETDEDLLPTCPKCGNENYHRK